MAANSFVDASTLALAQAICELPEHLASSVRSLADEESFASFRKKSESLRNALNLEKAVFDEFVDQTSLNIDLWTGSSGTRVGALIARNVEASRNPDWMSHWVSFYRFRNVLLEIGFKKLTNEIESGNIALDRAYPACMLGLYDSLARHIFHNVPAVARFAKVCAVR